MTCLCLTQNRRNWLPKAIECFLNQTYPNRELLIIADGESVRDLVPSDPQIRLVEIDPRNIGEKRNFGCSRARGSVIAHWDDDDHSEPERLSDQVARLVESGKAVTGYFAMRFHEVTSNRWWQYRSRPNYGFGTVGASLMYLKSWWERNNFPAIQIQEDVEFSKRAELFGQLVTTDGNLFMFARDHGQNSHARDRNGSCWSLITQC